MIRFWDCFFSLLGLIILLPILLVVALLIKIDSKGPVFFKQWRVGKDGKDFVLLKFRTMKTQPDNNNLLTVGARDSRITRVGYYLRKYKIDEIPQLINVLKGDMSLVGPRPEVRKYVDLYTPEQRQILKIKPGITDWASIYYSNENELLEQSDNPEDYYVKHIMPHKILLNMNYLKNRTVGHYFKIIFSTILKIMGKSIEVPGL